MHSAARPRHARHGTGLRGPRRREAPRGRGAQGRASGNRRSRTCRRRPTWWRRASRALARWPDSLRPRCRRAPKLRDAIARSLARAVRRARRTAENVVVTPGRQAGGCFCTALSLIAPRGPRCSCPTRGFPIYEFRRPLRGWRRRVVTTVGRDAGSSRRTWSADRRADHAPHPCAHPQPAPQPHRCVATGRDLAALADLAQRHDLWVISDEVYGQIRYDGRRDSIAALPGMSDRTVIVDGFFEGDTR